MLTPMKTNPFAAWKILTSLALLGVTFSFAAAPDASTTSTRKQLAKNLFFEVAGKQRRVVVNATVCLREGPLEGLLCRTQTKEHEYVLAAEVDGRLLHTALEAAGAKPGNPVQFAPKFVPARGSPIKVTLRYQKDGKAMVTSGRDWILDAKTKKPLEQDWVFAGSRLIPHPDDKDKPPYYLANQGDLICVCNMESAMMDLPFRSPKGLDERAFTANTKLIPPAQTSVEIVFEPVADPKAP